jgi:hypothetical protein
MPIYKKSLEQGWSYDPSYFSKVLVFVELLYDYHLGFILSLGRIISTLNYFKSRLRPLFCKAGVNHRVIWIPRVRWQEACNFEFRFRIHDFDKLFAVLSFNLTGPRSFSPPPSQDFSSYYSHRQWPCPFRMAFLTTLLFQPQNLGPESWLWTKLCDPENYWSPIRFFILELMMSAIRDRHVSDNWMLKGWGHMERGPVVVSSSRTTRVHSSPACQRAGASIKTAL